MKAIEFCLQGKMAHFRKYYSNSAALSYHVPPIATVKGIIAGLLGKERDSYYEEFSNQNCKIGIAVEVPLKKTMQTMNLLNAKQTSHLSGCNGRKQVQTEWVIPQNIRTDYLSYRIVFWHKDEAIMDAFAEIAVNHLEDGYLSRGIAAALGSAQCQGWISNGRIIELESVHSDNESVVTRFAVPVAQIEKLEITAGGFSAKKEELITEFDRDRYITGQSKKEVLIPSDGQPLHYRLKKESVYWTCDEEAIVLI